MLHRAQQRGVDEGRAYGIDADAVVALSRRILQKHAQSRAEGASAARKLHDAFQNERPLGLTAIARVKPMTPCFVAV